MVSYRGYGRSEGKPSESGIRLDAQSALDYLMSRKDIDRKRIILFGQGLGSAVSIDLASRHQTHISALILDSPWISIAQVIKDGWRWPMSLVRVGVSEQWNSETRIREMLDTAAATSKFPHVLLLTGMKDNMVPPGHTNYLFEIIGMAKKDVKGIVVEAVPFGNAGHTELSDDPAYFAAISKFIKRIF